MSVFAVRNCWAIVCSVTVVIASVFDPPNDVCPWNITYSDNTSLSDTEPPQPSPTRATPSSDAFKDNDCIQLLHTTNQSLHSCLTANDRYLFGQLDATIRLYQQLNHTQHAQLQLQTQQLLNASQQHTKLHTQNTQLLSENTLLSAQLQTVQTKLQSFENNSRAELKRSTASLTSVADVFSRSALERERIEELQKQLFACHSDIQTLQRSHDNLSQTLERLWNDKQELQHNFGECHVELGVKQHELRQCYAGAETLQTELEKVNNKFTNCTKVTRECKSEMKKLRDENKMQRKHLLNCTHNRQALNDVDGKQTEWNAFCWKIMLVSITVCCGVIFGCYRVYRYSEHEMAVKQQCLDENAAFKKKMVGLQSEATTATTGVKDLEQQNMGLRTRCDKLVNELDKKEQQIQQMMDTNSNPSTSRDSPADMVHITADERTVTALD